MSLIYPRLSEAEARIRLLEVRESSRSGIQALAAIAATDHPRAAPVATGGQVATSDQNTRVREVVLDELHEWVTTGNISRVRQAEFDARLGRVLHDTLDILPADAAHEATWNFLTLVVLPEVAFTRFPDLPEERALGTKRNVLRRAWHRWELLGELLAEGNPVLGEDELVGLLERTAVARNRQLVQALARAVLAYRGQSARSEFARSLYKLVRHETGPVMLDLLSQEELEQVVQSGVDKLVGIHH